MFQRISSLYRNAYGGIPREIWLLATVMLINRSGTMVIPFLSVYLTQSLHFSLTDAGLVVSCAGAGGILGIYIGGKLTDRFGHYYVQISSLTLGGLSFFVLMQMRSFETLAVTSFVLSVLGEAFRPANSTSVAFYSTTENRTRAYSLNRLAINLGWAVGPALGGLFATIGYQYLFIADGVTNLLAAACLVLLVQNKNQETTAQTQQNENPAVPISAFRDKVFMQGLLFTSLFAMIFMPFFSLVPVYWKTDLHIPELYIGLAIALNGLLVALVEMILIYFIEHRRHKLVFVSWGVLFSGLSYLLFNIFPNMIWIIPFTVITSTIAEMFVMPFMNSFTIERSSPQTRGQYTALYSMCYSFAHVAAPVLGTQIAARFGFNALWWGFVGISLLSFAGFRYMRHQVD
ncbi:MAG: MFS transporter [Spirosomaceae bacterium]|jgi:predicted MFS family arabinose efflux permease|nr:MFS transporter [Spirosomataceae bacterium]